MPISALNVQISGMLENLKPEDPDFMMPATKSIYSFGGNEDRKHLPMS